jgi:hypothetical protein
MKNSKKKTITNTQKLIESINIDLNKEEQSYLDIFFKKRFLIIENSKIKYPTTSQIIIKQKAIKIELKKAQEIKVYWQSSKSNAENYYKKIFLKKYFKKDYWKHKIKELTNKNYKDDFKNINISEETLMDPQYKHLLNAFLVDPDYRQKLTNTVNTSIIYKNKNIGDISKKKMDFKIDTANKKLNQINIKIQEIKKNLKINEILLNIIKHNKF